MSWMPIMRALTILLPATLVSAILAACAVGVASPSPTLAPSLAESSHASASAVATPQPVLLPGATELLPADVAAATAWAAAPSVPDGFDPGAAHPSPEALAEAYADALFAPRAGPGAPELTLAHQEVLEDGRVLVIVSGTGLGDDSVAGTQHAIVAVESDDGWRLADLYVRALCRRGVTEDLCV